MATFNTNHDLLSVLGFVKKHMRLYLFATFLAGAGIFMATRPTHLGPVSAPVANFVSTASLLLPANTRFSMASVFASTGQSDLDFWLSDANLFQKFLQRQRVFAKSESKLQKAHPALAPLSHGVAVVGVHLNSVKYLGNESGRLGDAINSPFDLANPATRSAGVDYAQANGLDEDWKVQPDQIDRIIIHASAASPSDSELLCLTVAKTLQAELEAVATRRAKTRRKLIENFIRVGRAKVAGGYRVLDRSGRSEPQKLKQEQARLRNLSSLFARLTRECNGLSVQLDQLKDSVPIAGGTPAQEALQALEREVRQAQLTFLPGNGVLLRMQNRLVGLQSFARKIDRENQYSVYISLESSLKSKSRQLSAVRAELQELSRAQPTQKQVQDFKEIEREINTWENDLLAWDRQLLQTRIEERLCRGDGTALMLQVPRPGVRYFAASESFLQGYQRTFKLLPLAPLTGIACILLFHLLQEARQIRRRVEYYVDAPVLGELPVLPSDYRSAWNLLKSKGRSASERTQRND